MANAMSSFASFNVNEFQDGYNSLTGYEKEEFLNKEKQDYHFSGMENWGGIDSVCAKYGFYQEHVSDQREYFPKYEPPPAPPLPISNYGMWSDFGFNRAFLSTQPIPETATLENIQFGTATLVESKKEEQFSSSLDYLDLLSNYEHGFKKLKGEKDGHGTTTSGLKLSTEEIIRLAGERYIQLSTQKVNDIFMFMHPYGSSFSGLSVEQTRDVELAHFLLYAAEKVGYQQFERASKLLTRCEWLASDTGSPVQRVVYYFSQALRRRIDRETGRFIAKGRMEATENNDTPSLALSTNLVFLKFHLELPFTQVVMFAGIQAILEKIASETKIHLIDLQIRSGVQWIILMQALAERVASYPIEHLKITAVGTTDGQKMEETGKKLASFAESLNLPFSFKAILLSDMEDFKQDHFNREASEEAVVIFAQIILRTMISRPNCLDTVMRVIRRLHPSIMVVIEVEANHNSPSFFNRFIEALFYFSAFFDCLEDCTDRDNQYRRVMEGVFFGKGIQNIVAAEGEERISRNVNVNVWRAFFARFGMEEIELSESSLYQANLILKQFACGSSCNLESDGKCLIVGWKGTPIHSLSTWKFL